MTQNRSDRPTDAVAHQDRGSERARYRNSTEHVRRWVADEQDEVDRTVVRSWN